MQGHVGASSPGYAPPIVAAAYRRRRLIWVGLKLALLAGVWALFAWGDPQDYDRLWWQLIGVSVGLPIVILASLRWVRPRLHACPACHSPAPAPARETFDLNALAGDLSGMPSHLRGHMLAAAGLVKWAWIPWFWLVDGIMQSAIACPNCHAWLRRPAPDAIDDAISGDDSND